MNFLTLLVPVLLSTIPALAPREDEEMPDGNKLVKATLLADREALKPGATGTLAVRFAIEPKWHVYWANPGDSGFATRVKFNAPAGWKVSEARFPAPIRHVDPGDIVTYVFEDELVMLADVVAPADAKPGASATIEVEADWLVCKNLCVPGSGKSSVAIAVADADKPANAALFDAAKARMPKPWSEFAKARATWSGSEAEPRLALLVPGATALEYFPLDTKPVELVEVATDAGKSGATLRASFAFTREDPKDAPRVRGVVRVKTSAGETSYLLDHVHVPATNGG